MGQNSSVVNRITLQLEGAIVKLESLAATLKEEANLKKETFQNFITELNKAVAGITDSKGCRLQFNVVAGTMEGHNWKSTVRVDCWKLDSMTSSVLSQCRFTMRQFQVLYDELMFLAAKATCTADSHKLKYERTRDGTNQSMATTSNSQIGESTDDDGVAAGPADEMCSLCMQNTTDLSLSCGHCFCQGCLEKWLHAAEKKAAASNADSQQSGDCPLCKPSKEYEALLKTRAMRGDAPLRVRVSPEMADELTSIPERIHAAFAEKRNRRAERKRAGGGTVTGIQRLPCDAEHSGGVVSDDDEDFDVGTSSGAKKESALSRARQLLGLGRPSDADSLLPAASYSSLSGAGASH